MNTLRQITRSPLFWVLLILVSIASVGISVHLFPKAFPIIDVEIQMDRRQAQTKARELSEALHAGPPKASQAVSFDNDGQTQTYIELSAGGPQAFKKMIQDGLYSPYTWRVRHFLEGETHEATFIFTPKGDPYGFTVRLPETQPGKALLAEEARSIAETSLTSTWHIDLSQFTLVEKSQEAKPSKRIDHVFTYEQKDQRLGEGRFRLIAEVSGDQVTAVFHTVKTPESFLRKYGEMRSSNNTITAIATLAMGILYLVGGCCLGLFYLSRHRLIVWKAPILAAAGVALFQLLEHFNQLPLSWMSYNTALSKSVFLGRFITSGITSVIGDACLLALTFMAAEGLTRKAFGEQIQLWRSWSPRNLGTRAIFGRTLAGYLIAPLFFSYVVILYTIGIQAFGWWTPSDTLYNPNGLASTLPWFTSIAHSLHAGFWEECLFRAIPLASATLLTRKSCSSKKSQTLWMIGALLLQAVIFGAAHANYPAQPSYARLVELIIPSLLFGSLYLFFGLLPGIFAHFCFDVISFALPIFATQTDANWINQTLVVFVALLPLLSSGIFLGIRLVRAKTANQNLPEIDSGDLNQNWKPEMRTPSPISSPTPSLSQEIKLPQPALITLAVLAVLSLGCWSYWTLDKEAKLPQYKISLSRTSAVILAQKALPLLGASLNSEWTSYATPILRPSYDEKFIWSEEGRDTFEKLSGTFLSPPGWFVRFVRLNASVEDRAEEYQVILTGEGEVFRINHLLPEGREIPSLEKEAAEKIALEWLSSFYHKRNKGLVSVSSSSSQLPKRRDWTFIYQDTGPRLKKGETRYYVQVGGNQITSSSRWIFIPEDYQRKQRNEEQFLGIFKTISTLVLVLFSLVNLVMIVTSWSKTHYPTEQVRNYGLLFGLLGTVSFFNSLPGALASLSTVEPLSHQYFRIFGFGLLKVATFSCVLSIFFAYLMTRAPLKMDLKPTLKSGFGFILGCLVYCLSYFGVGLLTSTPPATGRLEALDCFLPALDGIKGVEACASFAILLGLCALLKAKFSLRLRVVLWTVVPFFFGFSLGSSLQGCIFAGIAAIAFWFLLLEVLYEAIPFTTVLQIAGSVVLLGELRQLFLDAYMGVSFHAAIAFASILVFLYSASKAPSRPSRPSA